MVTGVVGNFVFVLLTIVLFNLPLLVEAAFVLPVELVLFVDADDVTLV